MNANFQCNPESCKRIEELRHNSEDQFRSVFDSVNDGLLILDQAGYVRDVNRVAHERLGYTKGELLGMHITQLTSCKFLGRVAERIALLRSQGYAMFESGHRCKDGSVLPVEVNVRTIELNGAQMYLSVARDISERKYNERALNMMQLSVDHMGDGAFWLTPDARIAYANDAACNALGYSKEEVLNLRVFDIDPSISAESWATQWEKSRKLGTYTVESTLLTRHGKGIPVEVSVNHMRYEGEEYHCTFVRDISKRKQGQRALKMMQFAMDNVADAMFWCMSDARITYANIAACRSLGYAPDEILSLRVYDFDPQLSAENWPAYWQRLKAEGSLTLESTHRDRNGRKFSVEVALNFMQFEGEEYICAFVRDITARKLAEDKIARLAHFDALTCLPNRALLYDRLGQSIALARRQNRRLAVLFLDLDGFKLINDSFGHYVGDDLLRAAADRLRENARVMDTVARVGGDEFIFILNEIGSPTNAAIVAQKVLESLEQPFVIQGHACKIGGSIGISIFPDDGDNMEEIIRQADDAMYLAKRDGKGNYQFANFRMRNDDVFDRSPENA